MKMLTKCSAGSAAGCNLRLSAHLSDKDEFYFLFAGMNGGMNDAASV
ncbi:hypothetical protein QS257_16055 [Terrilactibacillus sp. S3-3]|nr:hypothetical protein QS257_16055 [Terrilactibacillus sp. S3-3]